MISLVKFSDILKSKGTKNPTQNSNSTTSTNLQESLSEDDYVKRCLEIQYMEEKEDRTFRSNPAFSSVLTPLNSKEYSKAIMAGKQLLPQFADFDLLYKWVGDSYRGTKNYQEAKAILSKGLSNSKRKSLLLTSMGETEMDCSHIEDSVYYWSQALHCLSTNPIDYNAYLLLSYVAKGVGDYDCEQRLLNKVDTMRGGRIRLDSQTASNLITLISKGNKEAMKKVLRGLCQKYL
jgi:tetratricopeptide (TPR) repeat protein